MLVGMTKRVLNSTAFIWGLLMLPAIPFVFALANAMPLHEGETVAESLLHPTGEFAARFLIISMVITPMRMLLPRSAFWQWMLRRRRYFGVAAFGYALLHTVLYLVDIESLAVLWGDFLAFGIWTGWLAMVIFVPLALTSHNRAVRRLGRRWKQIQRGVYVAAIATLLHWMFVHNEFGPALVHFIPLAALETYRLWRVFSPTSRRVTKYSAM